MTFIQTANQPAKAAAVPALELRHLTYQELDILHALRGFCALYVVIFHAKYILWAGGRQYLNAFPRAGWRLLDYGAFALDMLSSAGYEMVVFFFVLSGFFIRYAQLKKYRAPLAFYVNRIVRIYPPYLASVLLAVALLGGLAHYVPAALQPGSARELNSALAQAWQALRQFQVADVLRVLGFLKLGDTYVGYNDVYWSLLPEALFYLFVPLAFVQVRLYYVASAVGFLAGIALQRYGVHATPVADYWLSYNFYFAVGAALYDVVVHTPWVSYVRRIPRGVVLGVAGLLFLALLPLALLHYKTASGIVATLLGVWAISGLLAGKVSRQNPAVRGLHWVGVFSFSLYLYHFPLLLLCYGLLVGITGEFVFYARYYWLAVALVTLVSYGLYLITERTSVNYFRKV